MNEQVVGQFKNGKRHGLGKMRYANGQVKEGMWVDNTFIN
jgi:antitoxin component YwqK of YwqJK toxin-antitoxin module